MVSKEETVREKAKKIWGQKCKECGYSKALKFGKEFKGEYLVIIIECPSCGLLLFTGQDEKYRWLIKE